MEKVRQNKYYSHFAGVIERTQLMVLAPAYVILCSAIIAGLVFLGVSLSWSSALLIVAAILLGVLLTIAGSFLYVIWNIQFRLQYDFDRIRNNVASGKIQSLGEFEKALCGFVTGFFHYSFFSVSACAIKIKDRPVYRHGDMDVTKPEEAEEKARKSPQLTIWRKEKSSTGKKITYLLPVWFGDEYLGFLLLESPNKLPRILKTLLQDFENNYIDDQLLHVINRQQR
ncbi:MAG: hypothetical protein K9J25_04175 [Bacteroidales bacterium]|nr:hypothetical protein [Bacteroidales bacterium]